jgi:CHAT domain-containing protein
LLDLLSEARADIRQGVDAALLERQQTLMQSLKERDAERLRLSNGNDTDQVTAIKKEIDDLSTQYEEVEGQIRSTSPRYAALVQPQPLTAHELQQQVLDFDTMLLEYALGEEKSFLWAVTADSLESFELPKRAEIETAARRVYDLLTARNRRVKGETEAHRNARLEEGERQYREAAAALSETVLGPVAAVLQGKRLLIVSDGALQYVPFAALPSPTGRGPTPSHRPPSIGDRRFSTPLVAEHEVISLPSASVLAILRRETGERREAPRAIAVLADPVFERDDPRVKSDLREPEPAGTASPSDSLSEDRLTRSAVEMGLLKGRLRFPRLAFTRREAEDILAVAPAGEEMKALDFKASLETATSPELGQYRFVHFATHGLLNSEHPELSGLVLSLVEEQGHPRNGFLQLQDVYNLNLPADLVVLSACETGLGKEIKGEGLMGLTRGFMYAGAARVVASLWKVDDVATAELMERFYRGMLKESLRPAEALRKAQIEMWKQKRWASPYYWGAFTIQGEWK